MNDKETADFLRKWCDTPETHLAFGWPTDGCGYDQHIRFVEHRNRNWHGGERQDFVAFVRAYADSLGSEIR